MYTNFPVLPRLTVEQKDALTENDMPSNGALIFICESEGEEVAPSLRSRVYVAYSKEEGAFVCEPLAFIGNIPVSNE